MAASGNIFLFRIITKYNNVPVDTGRKFNVHKTFRRRLGRLLNILCTFNESPVSTGVYQRHFLLDLLNESEHEYLNIYVC